MTAWLLVAVAGVGGRPRQQEVEAVQGERAVLECDTRPGCQWSRAGATLGPALPPRHSLLGCNLVLDPVQPGDAGEWECSGRGGAGAGPVRLRVLAPPGAPHIEEAREADILETAAGRPVRLTCESLGGNPAAELEWRHGDGSPVQAEVLTVITRQEQSKLFRTRSTLTFLPARHEEMIQCAASSPRFPAARLSPGLRVRLGGPRLELEPRPAQPGGSLTATCHGGRPGSQYSWLLGGHQLAGEKGETLSLLNLQPENRGMAVSCSLETGAGRLELTSRIEMEGVQQTVQPTEQTSQQTVGRTEQTSQQTSQQTVGRAEPRTEKKTEQTTKKSPTITSKPATNHLELSVSYLQTALILSTVLTLVCLAALVLFLTWRARRGSNVEFMEEEKRRQVEVWRRSRHRDIFKGEDKAVLGRLLAPPLTGGQYGSGAARQLGRFLSVPASPSQVGPNVSLSETLDSINTNISFVDD